MCFVYNYNCVTPLGFDLQNNIEALLCEKSGIQQFAKFGTLENLYLSKIDDDAICEAFLAVNQRGNFSRLEKMLLLAIRPLLDSFTITKRTAIILSTTKGNIDNLNVRKQKSLPYLSVLAQKIATAIGVVTKPIVISNACVSGAMAISVGKRLLASQLCDTVIVIAGDEISEFVVSGFQSFQAMSSKPCKPYDKNRDGITLGEAASAMILTTENQNSKALILGDSSINDANHISGPSRTGEGLFQSINNAVKQSGLSPNQIDIINAHGTATLYNDQMEAIAFSRSELLHAPVNSYKGYFGHTLGGSGLLETLLTIELSRQGKILKSAGFSQLGVSEPIQVARHTTDKNIRYFLKTASGFGGCNTALVGEILH